MLNLYIKEFYYLCNKEAGVFFIFITKWGDVTESSFFK